jgi:hypothetical protein
MKFNLYAWVILALMFSLQLSAQRNCATMDVHNHQLKSHPFMKINMEEIERQTQEFVRRNPNGLSQRNVVTIPVVFHVVYFDEPSPVQNISEAQIQSQLNVLNQDFSAMNSDFGNVPPAFSGLGANAEIQFCLAQRDPNGNATTGITRKASTKFFWDDPFTNLDDNDIKKSSQGGVDPWNPSNYLNIWICRISQSNTSIVAGFAQLPGGDPTTDGVVLDYRVTGTLGTALAPFDKGRTGTHEVGHWLNLRHIWGDATCGNDLVNDTPIHNGANGGCPTYPHLSTCAGTPVEMTMNYMDYTNDACMYMFTAGQKARMQAVLAPGGARASLLCSSGCLPPGSNNSCDAPTDLNISNVTASSVTINWNPMPNAVSYTLEYKPDYLSVYTVVTPDITGTSHTLTGLSAGTFYNFRIKTNCAGSSSCGYSIGAFSTGVPPTCNVPGNHTTTNITATSAIANWGVVPNAVNYTFEYKLRSASTWIVVSKNPITGTYTMIGLNPNTEYNYRVKTNCDGSESAYAANRTFKTLSACSGDAESNNTASTVKKTLTNGTAINGKIGTATDIDWYKFANTSSKKNIKVTLSNLPANYDLDLYSGSTSSLVLRGTSKNIGLTTDVINYNNGTVGTYYIKVYGVNSVFDNNNCYSILGQLGSSAFRLGSLSEEETTILPVEKEFLVFPNPANGEVTLVVPFGENDEGVLTIYDLTGKMISSEKLKGDESLKTFSKDISNFNPGVYMINFKTGDDTFTQKLIVGENK